MVLGKRRQLILWPWGHLNAVSGPGNPAQKPKVQQLCPPGNGTGLCDRLSLARQGTPATSLNSPARG